LEIVLIKIINKEFESLIKYINNPTYIAISDNLSITASKNFPKFVVLLVYLAKAPSNKSKILEKIINIPEINKYPWLIKIIVINENKNPIMVKVFGEIFILESNGINEEYNTLLIYNFNLFLCI
tara:strand:+ start:193 stop:564 length:372 start_codon:yes stop_codon:yes gene_type:complete